MVRVFKYDAKVRVFEFRFSVEPAVNGYLVNFQEGVNVLSGGGGLSAAMLVP